MNEKSLIEKRSYSLKRIWNKFFITIQKTSFITFKLRYKMLKLGGVNLRQSFCWCRCKF